ncbi:hypothetical protein DF3PA_260016 [Candidatus Defluviicoccus seviourii]|uniref:Uncharacterized protein n=1 Tax=Candidatus Defluviicoccus seviourii TaxID=2565273 RepID=A0A564WDV2_9PROT|nr:hypothetical protein DF3PA_260016 [Candidatus Defluviicoccus seviourii]
MLFAAVPHSAPLPAGYLGRTSAKSVPVVTAVSRNPTDEYCGRHSADYANANLPRMSGIRSAGGVPKRAPCPGWPPEAERLATDRTLRVLATPTGFEPVLPP